MKDRNLFFERIANRGHLPTLPHILIKLLDACSQEGVDLNEITELVDKDPSLSAKMIQLANSAYLALPHKVHDVAQAVVLFGTSGIRNMAICACVYEAFPRPRKNSRFNVKAFWWHSLQCAFLARQMADQLNSEQPDEVFLAGLLHDIGKLVLWANFNAAYENILKDGDNDRKHWLDAEACLGATHCEVGAWLLQRWHLAPIISDCVRYHHESRVRIAQALPITQIVFIANLLCQEKDALRAEGMASAPKILGLDATDCHMLIEASRKEARNVADSLDIDIDTHANTLVLTQEETPSAGDQKTARKLARKVRDRSLLIGTLEGFLTAQGRSDILAVMSEGLKILLDIQGILFFLLDPKKENLCGYLRDKKGTFEKKQGLVVSMNLLESILVQAIVRQQPMNSFKGAAQDTLPILDEQIIHLLGKPGIYCIPIGVGKDMVGTMVLAVDTETCAQLQESARLLEIFIYKGALALQVDDLRKRHLQAVQAQRAEAAIDLARKVVHEVNNPLGIIKNYLKIHEINLSKQDIVQEEIQIINEEINRVAQLLQQLTEISSGKPHTHHLIDLNALIMDIVKLTRESLLANAKVKLETDLASDLPKVIAEPAGMKQVFINLIKNAAEAMTTGGTVCIQSRALKPPIGDLRVSNKKGVHGSVRLQFIDDGPGIAEAIRERLFDPYVSSKKGDHSGLGLSIAYNIIQSFQGELSCQSHPDTGTIFTIELPAGGGE